MRLGFWSGATAAVAAAVALASAASAQSVAIRGPAGQSSAVTQADLAALPRQSVTLAGEHGPARRYEGVALTSLLERVGAPVGKALRGPAMADIVVIAASDGYRVALGLGETDPGVRPEKVILADKVDGGPLDANEGPFRLVVEGDLRPARAARQVTSITVEAAP